MTTAVDRHDATQSPEQPDSGRVRVRSTKGDKGRFYLGLVALAAITLLVTLAAIALLPVVVPRATSASITSGSMMPRLQPGDVVVAIDHGDSTIAVGTIVVFEDPRQADLVTHRIVAINGDGTYTTKGDANSVVDPVPVPQESIRGVGRLVVPYVGLPSVWLSDVRWLPLILTIAGMAAAAWFSRFAVEVRYEPWDDSTIERQTLPPGTNRP